ncbi:DHA2 family efflux MFS transporter permease subunit [Actinomadura chibensis]|uniref:DHA2 family efflux MFS transporter permease subunit n=1 Tax=Actinomadura chibensis TaxID=392828 RepID=A0A5D0NF65_9ACTN|nr:DHA2 family efflux MFS transporter permease subunit [Actinomadura chibensis]TYB43007.1 DHA2 family efflux MFS transporter permease subunit [Actinomadura chibensis]
MTETLTGPARGAAQAAYRWRWAALFVILAGEIMDMLDALITNIAAPTIRGDLGGSAATIQWLAAGYTLAMAVGLITGGRLGDLYGRRRMFLVGAAGFTVGSLLCGVAVSPGMLIGARVLQGLFGALMLPQGIGMIKQMFSAKEMGAAFAMFGPVMGLSAVGGPVLAGWLVDADYFGTGWRMIFLINLPLGAAAVLAGLRFLPAGRAEHASRLDLVGAALASVGAALLIYPLVQGREHDWPAWTFLMMAASVAVWGVFAWYETRKQRAGGDPLIVPSLFRKRGFTGGLVVGIVFFSGMAGLGLVLSLFFQMGLGFSPLKAGLAQIPWSVGIVLGFGIMQAVQRFGRTVIHAGAIIMAGGIVATYATLQQAGADVTPWQLIPALTVTGLGMGLLMGPFFDIVLAGVEPAETGSAGGTLTAVQQLGSALGAAVLGTIFFGLLGGHVASAADDGAGALRKDLAAVSVPAAHQERIAAGVRDCGHDRATAKDAAAVPASCARLEGEVRAAIAAAPQSAPAVQKAVARAGEDSAKNGFSDAMKITLWVEVGLLGLTFLVTFLLPMHARPEEEVA